MGKYSILERERRFLLRSAPSDLRSGMHIEDTYLSGTRLRLRSVVEPDGSRTRKLGHKVREEPSGRSLMHTTMYLDRSEWDLLSSLAGAQLTKVRHLLGADPVVAVDVFEGDLAGLVLAEVDLAEGPDVPDLVRRLLDAGLDVEREVTGDEAFTGGRLAERDRQSSVEQRPGSVTIRVFQESDWEGFLPILREVAAAGETYAMPRELSEQEPRSFWSAQHVVVAVDGEEILGSAKMGPNRPEQGAHIGTASFMVSSAARGRGVGRMLGEYVVGWHRENGFRGIQFNAVVETNESAVRLWQALGFRIIGTVPGAFRRPNGEYVGLHVMHLPL